MALGSGISNMSLVLIQLESNSKQMKFSFLEIFSFKLLESGLFHTRGDIFPNFSFSFENPHVLK